MIDLALSDDQREIVDAAATLLRDTAPLDRLRAGGDDLVVHATLAEWGWFGAGVPAEAGGLGLGIVEQALLHIEAGRQLLKPSILATSLAAAVVPEHLRDRLISGELRGAMGMPAADGRLYGLEAEGAAVLAMVEDDGLAIYAAEGFAGTAVEGFDEALPTSIGRVASEARLCGEPADCASLLVSAMLAGTAAGAAELAIEYAKVREQFGQPIGAFQAVKHRCTDMGVSAFAAEAQVMLAAATLAEGAGDASLQIACAARVAIDAARANGAGAVQVHGGMGFTSECHAHRFVKRAHVLSCAIGGGQRHTRRLLKLD